MPEPSLVTLPEFNGHPVTPEQEHELIKFEEHLENDPVYQNAIHRMAEEAKKDIADLQDPSKRNQALDKILAVGGDILPKEVAAVAEHDIHDTNPTNVKAYRRFGMELAALDTMKAAGISTDIDFKKDKHMTETTPTGGAPAQATTDPHAHDTAPADAHPPTEDEKRKHDEYGLMLDNILGKTEVKGGLLGGARETMIEVIGMIDNMLGGMITKQIHEMEVAAIKEKAAEVAKTVNENKEIIAVTTLGPVGLAAVGAEALLAPVVEKGVTAISESPVGKMIAQAEHALMQGAQDPVKLAAALEAVSKSVHNANNGHQVVLSDTQIPTSPKPSPTNKTPEIQVGANHN